MHVSQCVVRVYLRQLRLGYILNWFGCRELVSQDRIRVHINFFLSLALNCVANVLWYGAVHYDLLVNPDNNRTVLHRNPVRPALISSVFVVDIIERKHDVLGAFIKFRESRIFKYPQILKIKN